MQGKIPLDEESKIKIIQDSSKFKGNVITFPEEEHNILLTPKTIEPFTITKELIEKFGSEPLYDYNCALGAQTKGHRLTEKINKDTANIIETKHSRDAPLRAIPSHSLNLYNRYLQYNTSLYRNPYNRDSKILTGQFADLFKGYGEISKISYDYNTKIYEDNEQILKEKFPTDHSELKKGAMTKLKENNEHNTLHKGLPRLNF